MLFKFDINLSEQDYIEFNKFQMTKSYYGKKQIKTFRMFIITIYLISSVLLLLDGGFNSENLFSLIPLLILFVIFYFGIIPFFTLGIKSSLKLFKKSGKLAYSPKSVVEFYEDSFCETTEINKTEQKYSSIERVSVLSGKMIYIHINHMMAYLIPISCFDSAEHYGEFMGFLKTKCQNIDFY